MTLQQHFFNDINVVELDLIKTGGSTHSSHVLTFLEMEIFNNL